MLRRQFWQLAEHVRDVHIVQGVDGKMSLGPDMEEAISVATIKGTLKRMKNLGEMVRYQLPNTDDTFAEMCMRLSSYDTRGGGADKFVSQLNAFDYKD